MLDDIIEYVLREMDTRIKAISDKYKNAIEEGKKQMDGYIGEMFVGRAIKYGLLDIGFHSNSTKEPCTFWITPQYNADSNKRHGIDFKVDIRDANNRVHTYLIESKNWGCHYEITPKMFLDEILPRFTTCDANHKWNWYVTMNKRNIPKIVIPCIKNRIGIIPLRGKLTESSDINKIIKPAIKSFVIGFIALIKKDIDCEKCKKLSPEKMNLLTKTDKIKQYLREGYPDKTIRLKFNITQGNLSKIKSQMKQDGEWILDRRSKEADDDKML
jgi:hypothetical protein